MPDLTQACREGIHRRCNGYLLHVHGADPNHWYCVCECHPEPEIVDKMVCVTNRRAVEVFRQQRGEMAEYA